MTTRRAITVVTAVAGALAAVGLGGGATDSVTFAARPSIAQYNQPVTAFGTVTGGGPDQPVAVQTKPCDQPNWRDVAETTTNAHGSWTVDFRLGVSGLFRAASGRATSDPIRLQQRPLVYFDQRPLGRFRVGVQAERSFWRKKASVQRFDPARRAWVLVKTVVLTNSKSTGASFLFSSTDRFRITVPKGTRLRAVLPLSQARPCYQAGFSPVIRR